MLKRLWMFLVISILVLGLAGAAAAVDKSDVSALKAKVRQAAQYLAQKGPEALKEFNDPQGKWAAEPYVFAYRLDGVCLAMPHQPALVGMNRREKKDARGHVYIAEMIEIVKAGKQEGWVEYTREEPDQLKGPQVKKLAWVARVPGQDMFVGAGIYGVTKIEATAWGTTK